ncbi:MAG: nitrile hydratase subunit beta [Actinomycetota bacterium]|nr:nitrile hydratase subunit beta [Actinomycetota bacterium]
MDGIHDLGGRQGFGPVEVEPDEPVFHHEWEGRTFAASAAALGAGGFNTPMFRHAIERMHPAHYLSSGYYEHWLTAATTLLVEAGLLQRDELEARAGEFPLSQPVLVSRDDVTTGDGDAAYEFAVGDPVRVRDVRFDGHTRCPDYVRGRRGVIVATEPIAPIPECEAHRNERVLEATYAVRFDARELWGDAAEPNNVVHVDLHAHYLEGA